MTETLIFGVGSVLFIATTWASVAFGLQRMHELEVAEAELANQTVVARGDGLTELHISDETGSEANR